MSVDKVSVWAFCEQFPVEEPEVAWARQVALELGAPSPSVATAGFLRAVAALRQAHAAVEIGGGTGVSGLWILAGMAKGGVLTTIDPETAYQKVAASAFRKAGIPSSRTRFINGRPLDVLPRLAADSYDMMVVDGHPEETSYYITHAPRILRPGGALIIQNGLWFGNVADPARRDPHTASMREVLKALAESEEFDTTVLPIGEGVILATRK